MRRLTQRRLKELLDYDAATGLLVWKERPGNNKWNNRQAGKKAGTLDRHGHVRVKVMSWGILGAHRLAWLYVHGLWPIELDHVNGDRQDNRISNLREATRTQNNANSRKRKDNILLKGVEDCRGRYRARIRKDGRRYHLGMHDTPELANASYLTAAKSLYGSFARGG